MKKNDRTKQQNGRPAGATMVPVLSWTEQSSKWVKADQVISKVEQFNLILLYFTLASRYKKTTILTLMLTRLTGCVFC